MIFSLKKDNKINLPGSLEDFSLVNSSGLNDRNFNRIVISPKIRFKYLSIENNKLNDSSLIKFLIQLHSKVDTLSLSKNKITGTVFYNLLKNQKQSIEINNLILNENPINDFGFWAFTQLPWNIKKMDISLLNITDNSIKGIISKKINLGLKYLTTLNIGNNYISAKSITQIMQMFKGHLISLSIGNVNSINIQQVAENIPKHLEFFSLEGNILSDKEISILAPNLPKNLSYLDLRGSSFGIFGAQKLAINMPRLSKFFFDFKYGEGHLSFNYLLHNLSPYLVEFSQIPDGLSYKNSLLLAKKMPPYLATINIQEFENEECKIVLANLPNSLRKLQFIGELHSKGETLNVLSDHYPSHLMTLGVEGGVGPSESDIFLKHPDRKYLELFTPSHTVNSFSQQFIKSESLFNIVYKGELKPEYFKDINFSIATSLSSNSYIVPINFLNSIKESQVKEVKNMSLNFQVAPKELFKFIKKLPHQLFGLQISNSLIKLEDVDMLISVLPQEIKILILNVTIGENGKNKLLAYKAYKEEKTGMPFIIRINGE